MGEDLEPIKPGPKEAWKHGPLVQAIIANEAYKNTQKYKSVRELAEEFSVLPSTIYTYRTRLGIRKLIEVANNGQRNTRQARRKSLGVRDMHNPIFL